MKVVKPIEIYILIDPKGKMHQIKLKDEDKDQWKGLNSDRVVKVANERIAGNNILVYTYQSEIKGMMRLF